MRINVGIIRAALAVVTCGAAILGGALPAQAEFTQTWPTSADRRASADFIPTNGSVTVEGMACSAGEATGFYLQLVRTRDTHVMLTTSTRAANDQWFRNIDSHLVDIGSAHYLRWRGTMMKEGRQYSAYAPCQGVHAYW
ncbi:hypothetical protein ACWEIJ_13100 [Lentzea sp. NPDC004789]